MPRWRQDSKTGKLIPIDDAAREASGLRPAEFEPFVSPIDGTVISTRKQRDEHCKRHNVVPAQEFTPEYYERKARERAQFFNRELPREQKLQRKMELYERIVRAER